MKEEIHMAKRHVQKWSTAFVIQEMKAITKLAKNRKADPTSYGTG
jgi:hypothetical protein